MKSTARKYSLQNCNFFEEEDYATTTFYNRWRMVEQRNKTVRKTNLSSDRSYSACDKAPKYTYIFQHNVIISTCLAIKKWF